MVKETKFYDTLGLSPDASDDDIKRQYRKLALKFHPDKNKEPGAQEKFKEISVAYDALSDPEKRKNYDQYGEKGLDGAGGGGADPSDIFSAFFGGGRRQQGEPKPKDIVHELPVALDSFYNGKTVKLAITRDRLCGGCSGSGSNKPGVDAKCRECNGRGVQIITRQMGNFIQQMQAACSSCKGKGSNLKPEDRCTKCNGEQISKEKKVFEVVVEKGMKKGDFVAFRGDGDQVPGVRLSGDIIIVLDLKHHPIFTRKGDHLYMEQTISLAQALTGFSLNVTHLDGRVLTIRPPSNTCIDPDHLWAISREGMPVPKTGGSERGNLVIKFKVQFPQTLSDDDSKQLRRVLGAPAESASPPDAEEVYLSKTTIDLNAEHARHGKNDEDDDDDPRASRGGGGRSAQCASQ